MFHAGRGLSRLENHKSEILYMVCANTYAVPAGLRCLSREGALEAGRRSAGFLGL